MHILPRTSKRYLSWLSIYIFCITIGLLFLFYEQRAKIVCVLFQDFKSLVCFIFVGVQMPSQVNLAMKIHSAFLTGKRLEAFVLATVSDQV